MKEQILVVDDEPDLLSTLTTVLSNEGYRVKDALNGNDAIRIFKSEPFDLVITDIRMPGMDGLQLLKEIKKLDEYMEVIVLTGYASIEIAVKVLRNNGAFDYLTKPLDDIDDLTHTVQQALKKRALFLENRHKTIELVELNKTLQTEISEHKKTQTKLYNQLKYEQTIANTSTCFVNVDYNEIDNEITKALKTVGELSRADRSYLFQFSQDGSMLHNTHEWCREGIESQIYNLQNLSVEDYYWWVDKVRSGETIYLPVVDDLPAEAIKEKEILQNQGIKSLIVVPLFYLDAPIGFMGFDFVKRKKPLFQNTILMLKLVGEIFTCALERKRSGDKMQKYCERLKTLHMIEHSILAEDIPEDISRVALQYMHQMNTAYNPAIVLFNNKDDGATLLTTNNSNREQWGEKIFPQGVFDIIFEVKKAINQGKDRLIIDLTTFSEPTDMVKSLLDQGQSALLCIPLVYQGRLTGAIFSLANRTGDFQAEHIEIMQEVAHSLAIVIQHAYMRKELKCHAQKLELAVKDKDVLLRELHHRVKNNLQIISSVLNIQARALKDESSVNIFQNTQDRVKSMALVHEQLYTSNDIKHVCIKRFITELTCNLQHVYKTYQRDIAVEIDVFQACMDIDTAIPFGLIINELISNALKYAFPDEKNGEIKIGVQFEQDIFKLVISDNGIGLPEQMDLQNTKSIGLQLVTALVDQLDGTIELIRGSGTYISVCFPKNIINGGHHGKG